jgi:hypothetical protein
MKCTLCGGRIDPFDNFDVFGSWDQEHWSAEAAEVSDDDDEDA